MKLNNELRKIIMTNAKALRDYLLDEHVVHAEDFPDVSPEDQMLTKICVLVAACESISEAAQELNNRLSPVEEKENKEWN